eukprot:scaffold24397_cov18-Tisochrysis_lutea.AAC.2
MWSGGVKRRGAGVGGPAGSGSLPWCGAGAGARWCTPSSRMADASAAGRSCGVECLEQGNGEGIITEPAFEGSLREADET